MDSSVGASSSSANVNPLLYQLLEDEKEDARRWLRTEMDTLVDPLIDRLFNRLTTKLTTSQERNRSGGHSGDFVPVKDVYQQDYLGQEYPQQMFLPPLDHKLHNSELSLVAGPKPNVNPNGIVYEFGKATYNQINTINQPQNLFSQSSTSNLEQSNQNDDEYDIYGGDDQLPNDQLNNDIEDTALMDSDEPVVKTEFDDTSIKCEDEDDCDCDDCRNGIEVKEEDGDDDDDVQIIEDSDDGPSRPAKILRMDTNESNNRQSLVSKQSSIVTQADQSENEQTEPTEEADDDNVQIMEDNEDELSLTKKNPTIETTQQSLVVSESSRLVSCIQTDQTESSNDPNKPTEETDETNKVNREDKQIITLRVQCHQLECAQMFRNKTELNAHMSTQHQILQFRCVVKDCKQSFSTQKNLSEHIAQVHSSTTEWHCDKCPKHFLTYSLLYKHNYHYHHLGQHKCTFHKCEFIGEHKQKVFDHYKQQHKTKPTVEYICHQCNRRFTDRSNFNKHKRVHLRIKPFRCKFPICDYASSQKSNTMTHIKNKHLNQGSTESVDPREYLEVIRELL